MRIFSLFSGIGGFDLALQRLNHTTIGACEIDKYARLIYARHFPNVPIHEDATKINPKELPDFDLLCAGFPCQAFSIAGQRRGFKDTRGSLFFEIARIAKEKRPRYLLLENVKGLLNHDSGNTFRVIISTLDEMGYDAEWQVLNSKYFVPQNRERVFIVGHLRGECTRKIFPLGDINKQASKPKIKTIGKLWKGQSGAVHDIDGISPTLCSSDATRGNNTSGYIAVTKDHNKLRETKDESLAIDANYWKGPDNHGQRTMIYMAHSQGNIKQRIQERNESWTLSNNSSDFGVVEPQILAWSKSTRDWGVEKRIKVDEANTLSTGEGCRNQSSMNYVHHKNTRIRRLTPLECERLQGFPDRYTEGLSDTQRYKCLGNAVTVNVVEYIAKHIQ